MIKVAEMQRVPDLIAALETILGAVFLTPRGFSLPRYVAGVSLRHVLDLAPTGIRSAWDAIAIQVAWAQSDYPQSLDVFMNALQLRLPGAVNIATASRLYYVERMAETDLAFIRISDGRVWGFHELDAESFAQVLDQASVCLCSLGGLNGSEVWMPPAAGLAAQRVMVLRRLIAAYRAGAPVFRVTLPGRQTLAAGHTDLMARFGHLMSPTQRRRWSAADARLE